MKPRELVVEIGCEELPADWIPNLLPAFAARFDEALRRARLDSSPVLAEGGPRRLVAHADRVAERQRDQVDLIVGPPARVGRGPEGWTRAAAGFARKHGIGPDTLDEALTVTPTPRGDYVALRRRIEGRPAMEALPGVIEAALRGLRFPKGMNWDAAIGGEPFPFARPVRWILALFGDEVIPFRIDVEPGTPVVASDQSRGHRFRAARGQPGAPFRVGSYAALRDGLADRLVVLSPAERATRLEAAVRACEVEARAKRAPTPGLESLHNLVEWPGAVLGRYPESFLTLPEDIRHTVLVSHQKYLPLAGAPGFIAVTNMPDDPKGAIRRGAERVVLARLRDARFFWDDDRKTPLATRRSRLAGVRFHERLGSFRDKTARLAALAEWTASGIGADPTASRQAAALAKCDLTTGLVGEFASLQGVVGGLLLREEGAPEEVWRAVYDHYRPAGLSGRLPRSAEGLALSLADNADTLAGLFLAGLGRARTGAGDPFGLRRTAFSLIRVLGSEPERRGVVAGWPSPEALVSRALAGYAATAVAPEGARDEALAGILSFLEARLAHIFRREFPSDPDAVRAVVGEGQGPRRPVADSRARIRALAEAGRTGDLAALAIAATRVHRILPSVAEGFPDPDPGLFTEDAEMALHRAVGSTGADALGRFGRGEYRAGLAALVTLRGPVDRFFDDVLVMANDPAVRENRFALLARLDALFFASWDLRELDPARKKPGR